jgi:hypothetical protein
MISYVPWSAVEVPSGTYLARHFKIAAKRASDLHYSKWAILGSNQYRNHAPMWHTAWDKTTDLL